MRIVSCSSCLSPSSCSQEWILIAPLDGEGVAALVGARIGGPLALEDLLLRRADLDERVERGSFFHDFSRVCLERHLFAGNEVVLVPSLPLDGVWAGQLEVIRRDLPGRIR